MTQMHRAAVIASNEHQQDLQMQRETATQQLKKTTQELIGRRQMVADVIQALDKYSCDDSACQCILDAAAFAYMWSRTQV